MLSQEQNLVILNTDWQFVELWIDTIVFPPRILMLIADNNGKYNIYDPAQQYKSIFSSNNYDEVNSWLLEDEYERVEGKILADETIYSLKQKSVTQEQNRNNQTKIMAEKKSNQHYVPRCILRNFTDKNNQFFCLFTDQNGKIIKTTPENVCAEKEFYSFSLLPDETTRETYDYDKKTFDKLDGEIATVIKKIIDSATVKDLTDEDKKKIAKYIVYQYFRSPAVLNVSKSLSQYEIEAKQVMGLNLLDNDFMEKVVNIIDKLTLTLLNNKDLDSQFIISDSPVLFSPTAEIYFPIHPNFCLWYHKKEIKPLKSFVINELELRVSNRFNIAQDEKILKDIWDGIYGHEISKFCNEGKNSFWKCILQGEPSNVCAEKFEDDMIPELKTLIEQRLCRILITEMFFEMKKKNMTITEIKKAVENLSIDEQEKFFNWIDYLSKVYDL